MPEKEEFDASFKLGKEFLDKEIKKSRRTLPNDPDVLLVVAVAVALGLPDWGHVISALGRDDVAPMAVLKQLFPDHDPVEVAQRAPTTLEKLSERLKISGRGVRVPGMDNLMVRYSRCCQPVPGNLVVGYITRRRGVSIRRQDCPNVLALSRDTERRMDIDWAAEKGDWSEVPLRATGAGESFTLAHVIAQTSPSTSSPGSCGRGAPSPSS